MMHEVICFSCYAGHAVFEMAAGYELTHLRPTQADYMAINKKVRPVLEFIFEEGFPHSISEVNISFLRLQFC